MYPGLIDMDNAVPLEGEAQAAAGGGGDEAVRAAVVGAAPAFATLEEAERAKRTAIMRPNYMAAENLRPGTAALQALSSAGVTSVLAVPSQGIFKGQSALVNVAIPPDDPQISTIADYRGGLAVVKSPVANAREHGGARRRPGVSRRAARHDRVHEAGLPGRAVAARCGSAVPEGRCQRARGPVIEPALDALKPHSRKQMPVAFDVNEARENRSRARRWPPSTDSIPSSSAPRTPRSAS
jgi:hypothetical protein